VLVTFSNGVFFVSGQLRDILSACGTFTAQAFNWLFFGSPSLFTKPFSINSLKSRAVVFFAVPKNFSLG